MDVSTKTRYRLGKKNQGLEIIYIFLNQKLFKVLIVLQSMICASCENRKHYECIDCKSDHKTYLCNCDCHDENTKPHSEQSH